MYLLAIVLLLLGLPLHSGVAQSAQEFLDDEGTTLAPQLYVHNIRVDEITNQSTRVTGSFSLFNVGLQTAGDISHQASLVTLEKIGDYMYPLEIVTTGDRSDSYLVPNGQQEQSFAINIPSALPADSIFGVYVEIFTDDEPGAYEFVPITFDAKQSVQRVSYIDVTGKLQIGDENFYLLEGPTVLKGESLTLQTQVGSSSAYTVIQPKLFLYKGSMITEVPMRTLNVSPLTISATTSTQTMYSLPVDLAPGVYTIRLHYVNNTGAIVSPYIEGRYIIDGLTSNIHSVTYNELDQNKIDHFEISVQYAEKPLSARIGPDGSFLDPRAEQVFVRPGEEPFEGNSFATADGLTMHVTLTDSITGKIIDQQNSVVAAVKPTVFMFKPIYSSAQVNVSVELFEHDVLVDTHTATIEVVPRVSLMRTHALSITVAGSVIVVVIIGFFVTMRSRPRVVQGAAVEDNLINTK